MEYYVAEDKPPMERCHPAMWRRANLYIGVFAFRYGYVPQEVIPSGRSITELEYRKAQDAGIEC